MPEPKFKGAKSPESGNESYGDWYERRSKVIADAFRRADIPEDWIDLWYVAQEIEDEYYPPAEWDKIWRGRGEFPDLDNESDDRETWASNKRRNQDVFGHEFRKQIWKTLKESGVKTVPVGVDLTKAGFEPRVLREDEADYIHFVSPETAESLRKLAKDIYYKVSGEPKPQNP